MAGESPLFPSSGVSERPDAALGVGLRAIAESDGCRMLVTGMAEPAGVLGFVGEHAGVFNAEFGKVMAAIERLIRESDGPALVPGWSAEDLVEPAARQRLAALAAEVARDPASHGLAPNLIDFLRHAPIVDLRSIRPMALATLWSVPPDHAVELFLAAARTGIVAMGWDLLCPRCRGAKSRVSRLHELPKGAHCSSCNIDYERNFSRNVELTFHPEPWVRPLPDGEMCLLGQGAARHVKFQGEVAARSGKTFDLSLAPGAYRFRTVEAGAEADRDIGADGVIPTLVARGRDILLEGAGGAEELAIRNESERPLVFVIEDRNWAQDALTGERVIAMPAFRRLCPEQLLRPGDNAEIGWITIMFTDLKGSTELYDALGDVAAYNLVRDHFAFLSDRVRRNHGFIVKTVGDAVMAAFSRPDHAVRAALAIQDDVASFNSARGEGMRASPIVLKLGLHAGACIAVTTGDALDYFGATVNIAARLEHQCRGGEVIVSEAVAKEAEFGSCAGGADAARRNGDVAWRQRAGSVCSRRSSTRRRAAGERISSFCAQSLRATAEGRIRASLHDREREAVPALGADGLDRGRLKARLARHHLKRIARTDHVGIPAVGVGDRAAPDDIVNDDRGSWPRQAQRPAQIFGVVGLVGVDEDEIERAESFGLDLRQGVERRAGPDVDLAGEARAGDVFARDRRVPFVRLQAHQPAALGQRARQPDGGIAAERADFQGVARPRHAGEQMEELALRRGQIDRWQAGRRVGGQRFLQRRVGPDERLDNIGVDRIPAVPAHDNALLILEGLTPPCPRRRLRRRSPCRCGRRRRP